MNETAWDYQPTNLGWFKPVFSPELEAELVVHAVYGMQQWFYGLTVTDLCYLAYNLAEANGIDHQFSHTEKRAGIEWARSFVRRYPKLSLCRPEPTSMSRLTGFNRVQVGKFVDLLKYELSSKKYTAAQMYNVDETGITTVQEQGRIIGNKGSKQVGTVVSADRGRTTTIVCAMSASGVFIPPMLLFKHNNMNTRLMLNCPLELLEFHPLLVGWMAVCFLPTSVPMQNLLRQTQFFCYLMVTRVIKVLHLWTWHVIIL